MKIELTKNDSLTILVSLYSRILDEKINYTSKPTLCYNIYEIVIKMDKYIIPNIREKKFKIVVKNLITNCIKELGMIGFGKTKKRKNKD